MIKSSHLELSASKPLTLHIVLLWVSVFIPVCGGKKRPQMRLECCVIYGCGSTPLGVISFLCSLSRMVAMFPQGPGSLRSLRHVSRVTWSPSHGVDLKSSQQTVGSSHIICAILVPVYLEHRFHGWAMRMPAFLPWQCVCLLELCMCQ